MSETFFSPEKIITFPVLRSTLLNHNSYQSINSSFFSPGTQPLSPSNTELTIDGFLGNTPGVLLNDHATSPDGAMVSDTPVTESQDDFLDRLQKAVDMSKIPSMEYGDDYDCDDFAGDLEEELEGEGFHATFTAIWTDDGSDPVPGHALTDVHSPDGGIVWVEPQTGEIVDLDEDGDGKVMASDGTHSDEFMATEGMSQVEVYEDKASAGKAGVPID